LTNWPSLEEEEFYMKTRLCKVFAVLTVSVAVGASAAPPVVDSTTATTEKPRHEMGQVPPGAVVSMASSGDYRGPQTSGSAFVNGIPGGGDYFGSAWTLRGTQSGPIVADTAQSGLFAPPPYGRQNLPLETETPAATKSPKSNAVPTEVHRSAQEREMTRIEKLVREGGLGLARRTESRFDGQTNPAQTLQPDVSFSGDQINILKTFLK
jgi:hypothetical protein